MPRTSLTRSTPFRLALLFSLLFIAAYFLSGLVAFKVITKELDARYAERIQQTFEIISGSYADSDLQDLIDATHVHIAETTDRQMVFLLTASDGQVLASNIGPRRFSDGWSQFQATTLGIAGSAVYRIYAGTVGRYRLAVGASNQQTWQLQRAVIVSFGWASIVVILLAVAGGALVASRAQRRLDAVGDTMRQVSHGELSARIPLLGRGDDLDQLSQDVNEALDRLSASVETMRQVSTDIAHDLKTPLNHLKITLEDARLKQERGRPVLEDLEQASQEADQINLIFEALLRIAHIESGARKSRFAAVDLSELFKALLEVYSEVAKDTGHRIEQRFHGDKRQLISGDRQLLIQMYANLIENAIRHTPPGATIRLGIAGEGARLCTFVEDNGPGIPASEHEKVFRRLYRLEKSRTSPGIGLGLSLVKAVADLHAAALRLEDAKPGLRVVIHYDRYMQVEPVPGRLAAE
jgi:signal transduction histidine kinase